MTPDDPRHGTYAGASQHWKVPEPMCDPCALAASRRRKLNRVLRQNGRAKWVLAVGTVRRIRALRCLGWTVEDIARESELPVKTLRNPCHRGTYVHRDTFNAVAGVYERWCMTRPEGGYHERSRRYAARMGWAPPLAYDDIDDPDEDPTMTSLEEQRWVKWWEDRGHTDVDEAVVLHLLAGDNVPSTKPEKVEAMRRWLSWGRSEKSLCDIHGWKDTRYTTREDDVA